MQILLMKPPTINVGFYVVLTTDEDQTLLIMLSLMALHLRIPLRIVFKGCCSYFRPGLYSNNSNTYLQVEFDTGNFKAFATIAGHVQKAAGVRLPTSSKLEGPS